MARPEKPDWLDRAISEAAPGQPPIPDFEAWRAAHADALESLKRRAPQRSQRTISLWDVADLGRHIMRHPITRFAVAAVLVVGAFVLVGHWAATSQPNSKTAQTQPTGTNEVQRAEAKTQKELALAKQLYAQGNTRGLLSLLPTASRPAQIAAAKYLGEIGNETILSDLQSFAAKWDGVPDENPFQQAIEAIQRRLAQSKKEESSAGSAQEPNTVVVTKPAATKPQTGIAGMVLDKLTQKPVEGAIIQRVIDDPSTATTTDASGRFVLTGLRASGYNFIHVMAGGYVSQRITPGLVADQITQNVLIEMDRGSRVQGTVTDPSGKPIAGATARTFFFTNRKVVTGQDGRFEIDGLSPVVDRYSLEITHPDYPAVSVEFSPGAVGETVHQDVVLKPGADIYGQVTDPNGQPVEGVQVGNTTSAAMWNCITARTDHEGKYRLENVDLGELVLWAAHSQYALYVDRTTLPPGTTERQIDIRLQPPAPLRGKVVDQTDNPVEGVTVVVQEYNGVSNLANERYITDADGLFVIANAPAEGRIVLNPHGEGISADLQEFELGKEECVLKVHRAGRIYGKVIADATGEPVAEFTVKMTFSAKGGLSSSYDATWNREGFSFKSPGGLFDTGQERIPIGGNYQMTVLAPGFDPLTLDPVIVQPISDDPNRTVFRLKPATMLAGVVVDEQGNAIKDAVIALFSKAERFEPMHWRQFTSDAAGVFVVTGVGNEQNSLYVTAPGFAPHVGSKAELESKDGRLTRIVLSAGGRIFGQILDEHGQPRTNARVRMYWHSASTDNSGLGNESPFWNMDKQVSVDTSGNYELSGLAPGKLGITVESGPNRMNKMVTLAPGGSLQVDFSDEGGFVLTGVVRRGPTPVAGATISVSLPQGDSKSVDTDGSGRFRLSGIPAGQTTVTAIAPEDVSIARKRLRAMENRAILVQQDTEIDIDFGAGVIGGLVPEAFRGQKDLRITVYRWIEEPVAGHSEPRERWTNVYTAETTIDPNGWFRCKYLRVGRYYLTLSNDERTLADTNVLALAEMQHRRDAQFRLSRGQLGIRMVDARTGEAVPGARFDIMNDRGHRFDDKRLAPEDKTFGMMTDAWGSAVYQGLPPGQYQVSAWGRGYLPSGSGFVTIRGNETQRVVIPLQPAAMGVFELSESLKKLVGTDGVQISGHITNLDSKPSDSDMVGPYESGEFTVALSLQGSNDDTYSMLYLPEGRYRIDYELQPFDTRTRIVTDPVHKGTVTADLKTGQTGTIVLSE